MLNAQYFILKSHIIHDWLEGIMAIRKEYKAPFELHIEIAESINRRNFANFHIVTLSCLIDYAKKQGALVYLRIDDKDLRGYIFNDVRIRQYWKENKDEVFSTPEKQPFNLWRIEEKYYTNYSIALNQFFSQAYFAGKDLSGLHSCVVELFQNIIDHSESKGNAFFAIAYDQRKTQIDIAICDFGVGIPYTLRSQYKDQKEALQRSLIPGVSARTKSHNMGYGMDNIVSTMAPLDIIRIVSNKAFLIKSKSKEYVFPMPYDFMGTLIYFTISTDSFEELEIIDELNFG